LWTANVDAATYYATNLGSLRIGSDGTPSDTLDVDGTGNISGTLTLGSTLNVGGNDVVDLPDIQRRFPARGTDLLDKGLPGFLFWEVVGGEARRKEYPKQKRGCKK